MAFLLLDKICFSYGKNKVIENFSLEVEKGSFTTLLGESGCGKTTILKLISGFLEPTNGKIYIGKNCVNGVLPNKRKIGMVFQDYALFPHLTVEQNLLYGLKLEKEFCRDKKKMNEIILKTATSLGIENLLNRYPQELSGGQQQRVALGRAIVLKPDLLLMDEPLSSLDTKLRIKVREELREIVKRVGITTIYVTHDQEEALSLSDKIAVMNGGKLVQYGTPEELYFLPANRFVADFVGRSNVLQERSDDGCLQEVMIRPEWFEVLDGIKVFSDAKKNCTECERDVCLEQDVGVGRAGIYDGVIVKKEFLGATIRYGVRLNVGKEKNVDSQNITVDVSAVGCKALSVGDKIYLRALKKYLF